MLIAIFDAVCVHMQPMGGPYSQALMMHKGGLPRQTDSKVSQELRVVKSLLTAAFTSQILPY